MNRTAILEIADLIEQSNPRNFHMGAWFGNLTKIEDMEDSYWRETLVQDYGFHDRDEVTIPIAPSYIDREIILDKDFQNQLACNTTACIAGWTVFNEFMKNGTPISSNVESAARILLGLDGDEASALFYCGFGTIWDQIADKYEFDYKRDEPATWNFPSLMVADVLRKIVSREFDLSMDYEREGLAD